MRRRVVGLFVVAGAMVLAGCGGGGGGTTGGGGFIGSPNPTPQPTSARTFSVSNGGNSTFALVSTAVGTSDGDTSIATGSATVSRVVRYRVLHREVAARGAVTPGVTPVDYDNLPQLDFFVAETNQTVTLNNRTPGVLGNAGTRPSTIVTYVDQVNGQDVISTADLQKTINAWETSNPFGANGNAGIYNTTRGIFGSEWTAGGGRDGDPRVVVLFLNTEHMGDPALFGFVDLNDEMAPRGQTVGGQPSNGGEIIYVQAQPTSVSNFFQGDGFDGFATLAHELHHLIIFNNKVAQQGAFPSNAQPEETTIDEGLSTLAEEDNGFNLTATGGGNSFMFDAIQGYETTPQAIDNFFVFNDLLQDFGKGYLFFKHVQEAHGLSAITAIDESTGTGSANVTAKLGTSFGNELQAEAIANYVSGLPGSSSFTYPDLNLAGTFSLHANNNSADAFTSKLPGISVEATVPGVTAVEAWSALYLGVSVPSGSSTITVNLPANQETSLVQLQNGSVTSVTF
ncbi:MAG TPA: hypothetical protein VGO93_06915 [Candidatus Xenobia bacterium]